MVEPTRTITKADKVCPECGKPIRYETVEIFGQKRTYEIKCECVVAKEKRECEERQARGMKNYRMSRLYGIGLLTRHRGMTFEAFAPRKEQQAAYDACKAYSDMFSKAIQTGLMLAGQAGCGKTHLAVAIAIEIAKRKPLPNWDKTSFERYADDKPENFADHCGIQFIPTAELLNRIKKTYDNHEDTDEIIDKYKKTQLLILDDLGAERETDWALEQLYEIIDYRYNELLPLIVTTNLTASELTAALGDRTSDRLRSMCKLLSITAPSQRKTLTDAN